MKVWAILYGGVGFRVSVRHPGFTVRVGDSVQRLATVQQMGEILLVDSLSGRLGPTVLILALLKVRSE